MTSTTVVEKIPGTKAVGQRIANAELQFRALIQERINCTEAEALHAFQVMRHLKVIKLDCGVGRYTVTHGSYFEPDVLRNAVEYALPA